MRWRGAAGVGALLLVAGSLAGCAAFDETTPSPPGVQVAAAFYALEYVADRVAGDHATITELTTPGREPHDLELSPQQTADVAQADLVLLQGGFQPAVDDAAANVAGGTILDVADVIERRTVENGDPDPHFWQDPLLLAQYGDAVAGALADIDPGHAADYAANAADLRADLEELDTEYTEGLAGCERSTIVVSHEAFGYLEKYGLTIESILGLSPEAEPTPHDLARLQELVKDEGITTVFSEALAPPEIAESLAHDAGVETAVLDPIEGLSDETADEDYLSLMRTNLAALEEANGCG